MYVRLPILLVLVLVAATLGAQTPVIDAGTYEHHGDRIQLKLTDAARPVWTADGLASRTGHDLRSVAALLDVAVGIEPLVDLPLATLDAWHDRAQAAARDDERIAHLASWFRVRVRSEADGAALIAALREQRAVEVACFEPRPSLPGGTDLPPTTPDFRGQQGYVGPTPAGIAAARGRVIVGGRGRGVQVVDMEQSWINDHEDICKLDASAHIGTVRTGGNHGTAVCGEMVGDRNGYGVTGICDAASLRVSSWNNGGVANAIAAGINASAAGDIVLLEVHYNTSLGYVPAEYFQANFDVIRNGTALGVHIVEAAGNGGNDLDDTNRFQRLFDLTFRDSGAIMVGATSAGSTNRAGFSNHGARITANGWGTQVTTTGYGNIFNPNDARQRYTGSFSGTSSASPIVTGAVAQFVGAVRFQDEHTLTIAEVRQALRTHGTPCSGKIQNRPDVGAMLAARGLPDGLDVSAEAIPIGTDVVLAIRGTPGHWAYVLGSDTLAKTAVGFNRALHLDVARLLVLAFVRLDGQGEATVRIPVPAVPALRGTEFFFQRLTAGGSTFHMSSSAQIWIP